MGKERDGTQAKKDASEEKAQDAAEKDSVAVVPAIGVEFIANGLKQLFPALS